MSNIKETKTDYSANADNYVYTEANDDISVDELTVTITLNEYRKLVTDQATMKAQIDKAEKNKWERERENDMLKQENEQMKAEMFDLKKKLEEFEENAASMQQTAEYSRTHITPTGTGEVEE